MEKYDPLMDSTKLNDSSKIESAKRFLANITWVYENVQERGTKPADGRHNRITIKRFAPGAPNSCVREVLDILTQQAPYQDPVISNTVFPGKWKPKVSWFRKDSRYETVNNRTASVTLIQELIPADEEGDSEVIDGGGNCTTEIVYKYVWDATEVELPEEAKNPPQGVQYSVNSVSRDDDTGLFSYYITKHVAITQKDGPYISDIRNSAVTWTTTWKNAYEIPEGLPADGETVEHGVVRQVSRRQNDDCTWDITLQETRTVEHDELEQCKKVYTEHTHTKSTGGNGAPLGEAPEAGGGKHYEYASRKEEDGTYTHTKIVTNEISRDNYRVTKDATLYGTRETIVDLNKASFDASVVPDIGESVQYEMTPGGRYNVTRTCVTITSPGEIRTSRGKTVTQSECSDTTVVKTKGDEAASAYDGELIRYDYRRNEYGTWDRTKTVTTEHEVIDHTVVKSLEIDGGTVTKTSVNLAAGTQCEVVNIGDSVKIETTPGGLVNITKTEMCVEHDVDTLWSDQSTKFAASHSETTISKEALECTKGVGHVQCAGGGEVHSAESRLTNKGAYQNTESVQVEYNVDNADVATAYTAFGKTTTTKHRSRPAPDNSRDGHCGVTVRNSVTNGGLYDVEITEACRKTTSWDFVSNRTAFNTVTEEEVKGSSIKANSTKYGERVDVTLADDGLYDITKVTVESEPQSWTSSEARGDGQETTVRTNRNSASSLPVASVERGVVKSSTNTMTELGEYDTTETIVSAGCSWFKEISLPQDDGITHFTFFKNYDYIPEPSYSGNVDSASASVSMNQFGLYDGSFTVAFKPKGGSGATPPSSCSGGGDSGGSGGDGGNTCANVAQLGCAVVQEWSYSEPVESHTTEFYSGIAYDVTWSAMLKAGVSVSTTPTINGSVNLPGGPGGGVFPFATGYYYMFYSDVKRKSVTQAGSTVDANGAPIVSSSSCES